MARPVRTNQYIPPLCLAMGLFFAWRASRAPVASLEMAGETGSAVALLGIGVAYGFARGRSVVRAWATTAILVLLGVFALAFFAPWKPVLLAGFAALGAAGGTFFARMFARDFEKRFGDGDEGRAPPRRG